MKKNTEFRQTDELLKEADTLVEQINSDVIRYVEEDRRIQFEKHVQELKALKSRVHPSNEKSVVYELTSSARGMHEAIQDIIKAMHDLIDRFF